MKVNTAAWIEKQMWDTSSAFFNNFTDKTLFSISADRDDMIKRLEDPSLNCLYAAIYVSMIMTYWNDILLTPRVQNYMPGIVATIYSLGLTDSNGNMRKPHLAGC
jgi:hypothetical protein